MSLREQINEELKAQRRLARKVKKNRPVVVNINDWLLALRHKVGVGTATAVAIAPVKKQESGKEHEEYVNKEYQRYFALRAERRARDLRSANAKRGWLTRRGLKEEPLNYADRTLPAVIPTMQTIPLKVLPQQTTNPHTGKPISLFLKITNRRKSLVLESFGIDNTLVTGRLMGTKEHIVVGTKGKRVTLLGVSCYGKLVPIKKACRCTPQMAAAIEHSLAWQKDLVK